MFLYERTLRNERIKVYGIKLSKMDQLDFKEDILTALFQKFCSVLFRILSQETKHTPKLTIETLDKTVKYVQS